MVTPIIKATQGKKIKSFYTLTDYGKWKEKKITNGKSNIIRDWEHQHQMKQKNILRI